VSAVDNHGSDPARIWFFRNLNDPTVVRDPLVLRKPDGTAYDGTNSDNEGLAILPDVSNVANLSQAPARDIVSKKLVTNLVDCPALGAPSRETQANPLLDNYEGMTIIGGPGLAEVSLISDDNFSPTQFTRVLNLAVKLP
jgi:hypothetical protein